MSENSTLKEMFELLSEIQYLIGHWKVCKLKLKKSEISIVRHG